MATFSTAAVTARTSSGCTITFNAAAIDCNAAQLKQLLYMFERLVAENANNEGGNAAAVITVGALG